MNFFRPFRAYRPYKLFGAGGALPSFRAFTYDPSTYELLSYHSGEGDVETDRVAVINVPDMDGVYHEIPGGQIAYPGARYENGVAYADDGTGTLLDPIPSALVAPEATNYFLNSQAPVTQDVAGRNGVHTVSVIGTGSVTLSGGLTGVVSDGSPVTGDPSGVTVTCTVSGTPDNVQFENSSYVTQPIYTATASVLRDKDEIILDNANLNTTEGSIYFELTPGQDTTSLLDGFMSLENGFMVIDDGTNVTAAAALVDTNVESAVGMVWSAAGIKCCANGTWSQLVPYDGTMNDGVLDLFRDAAASNQIRELQIWDSEAEQEINSLMPTAEDWGTDFVMVVKTTADDETFTLSCGNTGTYNANIDWGDGEPDSTITTYNDADLAHTFAEAGDHTIKISGVLPWIYFNNGGDKDKVIGVLNGGSIGSLSCGSMFRGCSNLIVADLSNLDTSLVTEMLHVFRDCSSLIALDVSGLDTTLVTNMGYMFLGCSSLTMLDLSGFDTALVENMSNMFYGCTSLFTLDVSGFDTSSVNTMYAMFRSCSSLATIDFSGFNTSLVTNMSYMFYNCQSLTTIDVSGFDTALVASMPYMFYGCSSLTTLDLLGFDTALVASMYAMFHSCTSLTTIDVSGFDTSLVTNMGYMFYSCSSLITLDGAVLGNADIVSATTNMFVVTTALSQESLDDILAKMYANRANYTWATPVLDLSPPTAVPSGVYQDATPPTTGEEFRYKLENDPDGEGFNTWTITV